ncbi:MAG: prolipoprotein diacylglyceryl transferase [Saprospiraceae bacterium]|nr:prolipoprotein diacylglyceryl transferase [Saprospiraceae bacterium]
MYPDLSYFLHAIFGTPPDNWASIFKTFGLFLVLAILGSAYLLYIELKRKAQEGLFKPEKVKVEENKPATMWDLISNAVFGFILGFKLIYIVQHFAEFQMDAADVVLSLKGSWLGGILGAAFFAGFRYWESQRHKKKALKIYTKDVYPHHLIGDITIIAAVAGVIGAKIFDVLEHLPDFFEDPLGTLLSGGGLAIYGGLIFGFFSVVWYLRRKKIPVIHVMDAVAPALIIGYGIGRLGCQFSGDGDWGIVAAAQPGWWFLPHWLWAFDYPHHVLNTLRTDPVPSIPIEGCTWEYCMKLSKPVYPTPIYETFMAFAIGGILWALRKRLQVIPGMLFFLYLILNGIERFFIEKIRVNIKYSNFGIEYTQAELIAVGLVLLGIAGCVVLWRKRKKL